MIRLFQSPTLDSWVVHKINTNLANIILTPYDEEWYKLDRYYVHKSDITDLQIIKKRRKRNDKQTVSSFN